MMLPWTMQTVSWLRIAVPYRPGHLGSVRFRKTGGVTRSRPSTLLPAGTAARCDALPIAIALGRCHTMLYLARANGFFASAGGGAIINIALIAITHRA
jgi:hypothetical protein